MHKHYYPNKTAAEVTNDIALLRAMSGRHNLNRRRPSVFRSIGDGIIGFILGTKLLLAVVAVVIYNLTK